MREEIKKEGIYDARELGVPTMLFLGLQHMFAFFWRYCPSSTTDRIVGSDHTLNGWALYNNFSLPVHKTNGAGFSWLFVRISRWVCYGQSDLCRFTS